MGAVQPAALRRIILAPSAQPAVLRRFIFAHSAQRAGLRLSFFLKLRARSADDGQRRFNVPRKPVSPVKPDAPSKSAAALASVGTEMAKLDPSAFAPINLDIPQAVALVLGVTANVSALRSDIAARIPSHPLKPLDNLETYALAAYHAHILWLPRTTGPNQVTALLDEATPLRANLLSDAIALAKRGLFDEKVVEDIRAGKGNVDTANDLVALAALFTSQWSTVENKTAATWDEVLRAGELGPTLLAALGVREFAVSAEPDALSEQRKRAFTLFYNAYDETRRAITYLRWHEGDADDLADLPAGDHRLDDPLDARLPQLVSQGVEVCSARDDDAFLGLIELRGRYGHTPVGRQLIDRRRRERVDEPRLPPGEIERAVERRRLERLPRLGGVLGARGAPHGAGGAPTGALRRRARRSRR